MPTVARYLPPPSPQPSSRQLRDAVALFEGFLAEQAALTRTPGVSYAVHAGGKTIAAGGYGVADMAGAVPATATTGYRCASITKTVTATLLMQLVEQGKVRLDDPASSYLAWARPALEGTGITLRHLLLHAGGVIRDGSGAWSDHGLPTRDQIHADVLGDGTFAEPSVTFRYSNIGYSLLGEVIEQVTGKAFAAVVDQKVVRPLNLKASGTSLTAKLRRELATGYFRRRPGEQWRPSAVTESAGFEAAGGLISNAVDLCRYQDAHMPGDDRLLSELSKREMQRTQWQRAEPPHHGFAWILSDRDGIAVKGHSGGYPGFVTQIGFAPSIGISAAVLTNTIGPLAEIGLGGWYHILAVTMARWQAAAGGQGTPTRAYLDRLTGHYRGEWADVYVGLLNRSLLLFWAGNDRPMATGSLLQATGSDHRFVIADQADYGYKGESVSFEVDERERGTALRYGPYRMTRDPGPS